MEYKNYTIDDSPSIGIYYIHSVGSGALPKSLRGGFTSQEVAKKFIDLHEFSVLKEGAVSTDVKSKKGS